MVILPFLGPSKPVAFVSHLQGGRQPGAHPALPSFLSIVMSFKPIYKICLETEEGRLSSFLFWVTIEFAVLSELRS